jgi:hypothetical protein
MDARGEAGLVEEHLNELAVAREVRVQALDREKALKPADPFAPREIHRRHAAARQLGDQLEAVQPFSNGVVGRNENRRTSSPTIKTPRDDARSSLVRGSIAIHLP